MAITESSTHSESVDGFVLTRQFREGEDGVELEYWLASSRGALQLVLTGQECVCFVPSQHRKSVKSSLSKLKGWRSSPVKLRDFSLGAVDAIYCRSRRLLYDIRDRLLRQGI